MVKRHDQRTHTIGDSFESRVSQEGFTLVELMVAFALLAIILVVSAQSLISHFHLMYLQEQRTVAAQNCEGVLGAIRQVRDLQDSPFPGNVTDVFPDDWNGGIEDLITQIDFPNDDANRLRRLTPLNSEIISIAYDDVDANPLQVVITSSWLDLAGRRVTLSISTVLTDA